MNARIDVIEVLRLANPVPPGSIDEQVDLTAARRASLRAVPTDVPVTWPEATPVDHRRRWPKYAAAAAAGVAAGVAALFVIAGGEDGDGDLATTPATEPAVSSPSTVGALPPTSVVDGGPPSSATGPFLGVWVSTDVDGSSQTMEIVSSGNDDHEMVVRDDSATAACSGAPSTMTGTGRLETDEALVIAEPELTCDDGTTPAIGPPPQEELANFTFVHDPATEELVDEFGVVWRREGATTTETDPPTSGGAATEIDPPTSGGMWPQSSVDEVREAQELADAGDAAYTWQVAPLLSSQEWWAHLRQPGAEIVERFLREELGWDEFLFNPYAENSAADGVIRGVVYLRCAPGETNRLYPTVGKGDALGADRCAPTIDDRRYETVSLDLSQLDRRGRDGIWVVSRWTMTAPFAQTDPRVAEANATARLEDFLAARVEGHGAEGYVDVGGGIFAMLEEVPLLYATTTGAPYERFEIERVSGPHWPYGDMDFEVRLFAEGGESVVEQLISVSRSRLTHRAAQTTENGQPVAVP